ncbi:MAG: hypothetical protein K2O32_06530 [Acetatifactor sp.]|nr:hypothetical protein [Acetatifactor sp.]
MRRFFTVMKGCIIVVDIICIILSLYFIFQIRSEHKEYMRNQTDSITVYDGQNIRLALERKNKEDFVKKYADIQEQIEEAGEVYIELQKIYGIKTYMEDTGAKLYQDSDSNVYIERYFKVEQGELQEKDVDKIFPPLEESEKYGNFLPVGDGIWLRYEDYKEESLPIGIVITDPQVPIGYGQARAGMVFWKLKGILENESGVRGTEQKVSLEELEGQSLCVEDNDYCYYFLSIESEQWSKNVILYITKKIEK